jgi:Flp pilus assembly protein TadD
MLKRGGGNLFKASFNHPPVLKAGLYALKDALLQNDSDPQKAADDLRAALKICDEGTLWALLGAIEWKRGNFAGAIEPLRKAQTTPALLGNIKEAARLLEGAAEVGVFGRSLTDASQPDTGARDRAAAAFLDFFQSGLPKGSAATLAMTTALRVPDKFLARSIAQTLPADSIERLRFEARIECADGNGSKALEKADRALELEPDDESLASLREKIESGTLDPLMDN